MKLMLSSTRRSKRSRSVSGFISQWIGTIFPYFSPQEIQAEYMDSAKFRDSAVNSNAKSDVLSSTTESII